MKQGWNEFVLQVERADKPLDQVHFMMSSADLAAGFADLVNTYFPWEEAAD